MHRPQEVCQNDGADRHGSPKRAKIEHPLPVKNAVVVTGCNQLPQQFYQAEVVQFLLTFENRVDA